MAIGPLSLWTSCGDGLHEKRASIAPLLDPARLAVGSGEGGLQRRDERRRQVSETNDPGVLTLERRGHVLLKTAPRARHRQLLLLVRCASLRGRSLLISASVRRRQPLLRRMPSRRGVV